MRVAIVGFPYCGKSTLFRAISGIPLDHLRLAEENLGHSFYADVHMEYVADGHVRTLSGPIIRDRLPGYPRRG